MARFVKGDIVVVLFPFSDLSSVKKRPAFVLADLSGEDVILCQITSRTIADGYAIPLSADDFTEGNLNQESNIRPNRIFTADQRIIQYRVGKASSEKTQAVISIIIKILTEG
jgi:mRNA interferase MazF